ncbi:hypothetical protein BD309DRAFT_873822 [Dichomitus squalens]|uniref:Uncharacterized protein n=1 Tax=Dichomitus squalens TaxID=114155 RepID=A0A4Q9NGG1_9APHY|nr:uncharacterized protein DICSQDRAFT_167474 [Dichomitus squalens LYAD-421 SS1]EJF64304.1 hypothetical protein DICSQDRAFT_167474 [Dichomitus squalens LYAD-421 SS1]TBU38702.1 hypothetical protein BD309DRAFT_873822 [Dichomitus squalens]TBU59491.1 hypothetical protein BD310DRAFT_817250 [Dichomitus squalens]
MSVSVSARTVRREEAKSGLAARRAVLLLLRVDSTCEAALGAWERFAASLENDAPHEHRRALPPPSLGRYFGGSIEMAYPPPRLAVALVARYWVWAWTWTCAPGRHEGTGT